MTLDKPCEIHDPGLTDMDDDLCCYHSGHLGRSHTLHLPVTEPKLLLTSNQRLHWRKKAELTAYWRELGAAAVDLYEVPAMQRAHVTVTFRWPDKRRRDPMNWWPTIKAISDGMVQAGTWLPDDDDAHLIGPDMRRDPERGPHSIRIDIEEIT